MAKMNLKELNEWRTREAEREKSAAGQADAEKQIPKRTDAQQNTKMKSLFTKMAEKYLEKYSNDPGWAANRHDFQQQDMSLLSQRYDPSQRLAKIQTARADALSKLEGRNPTETKRRQEEKAALDNWAVGGDVRRELEAKVVRLPNREEVWVAASAARITEGAGILPGKSGLDADAFQPNSSVSNAAASKVPNTSTVPRNELDGRPGGANPVRLEPPQTRHR
ncbi:hypothetical protein OHA02_51840 [Streptomyces phaeochromogenes]|nr:hypothetical protein [Streptomyces phaeochromogenes]